MRIYGILEKMAKISNRLVVPDFGVSARFSLFRVFSKFSVFLKNSKLLNLLWQLVCIVSQVLRQRQQQSNSTCVDAEFSKESASPAGRNSRGLQTTSESKYPSHPQPKTRRLCTMDWALQPLPDMAPRLPTQTGSLTITSEISIFRWILGPGFIAICMCLGLSVPLSMTSCSTSKNNTGSSTPVQGPSLDIDITLPNLPKLGATNETTHPQNNSLRTPAPQSTPQKVSSWRIQERKTQRKPVQCKDIHKDKAQKLFSPQASV